MSSHVEALRKKLKKIQALAKTLKAGVNARSAAETRGEISNIFNRMNSNWRAASMGPNSMAAANIMNNAQKIVHGKNLY
jgi:hypothetical protein